jgi:hypothetical protein
VEEPQENGLTSRAKAIFMIVLAVLLLGMLEVFALLATTLPTSVPSDERVSALLLIPIWIIIAIGSAVLTLVMFRDYGAS